jgi:hypothetical protein
MKTFFLFLLLFVIQVSAFAVTPTTIDAAISSNMESRTIRIYNDKPTTQIYLLKTEEKLIELQPQITVPANSHYNVNINIKPNNLIKDGFYTNKIYIIEQSEDNGNINLETGLAIKTRILVKDNENKFQTKLINNRTTEIVVISLILTIVITSLLIIKFKNLR